MLKLGIMQPYFFPYAQQFRHISQCDKWIIFDTPKFSKKSWVCRNRIINRNTGWSYISVPIIKSSTNSSMNKALIVTEGWEKKVFDKLKEYKHSAPFYEETKAIVEQCFCTKGNTIVGLNSHILRTISKLLEIDTKIENLSELSLDLPISVSPGEWACHISKAIGANVYSNASGGEHIFDRSFYKKHRINLEFYKPKSLKYDVKKYKFVSDLSIIDSLMWMGVDKLREWCKS